MMGLHGAPYMFYLLFGESLSVILSGVTGIKVCIVELTCLGSKPTNPLLSSLAPGFTHLTYYYLT